MTTTEPTAPSRTVVQPIPDKPHGPVGGWARRVLGPLHVTGVFWYRAHYLVAFFPRLLVAPVTFAATCFFWAVLFRIRAAVASNLEAVLGPCGFVERQLRIWRTFHDFAWCYTERYESFRPKHRFHFEFEGEEARELFTNARGGFVMFTPHFGNWELGPLLNFLPPGRKVHVVREPELNEASQRFVQGLFDRHHLDHFVVHYAGSDLEIGVKLLQALRRGDVVAMPGDRPRAGAATLATTLFGRPMEFPPGPAHLARGAGALMAPIAVFRLGRRHYRVVARPPFAVARTADKSADIQAAVDRMAAETEWAIRQRPTHWFCWRKLW